MAGTVMGVVQRSYTSGSAVDTRVVQSSWNLDIMDGTGPSGINLDFTKCQIFFIDLEWLGVGRVRLGFVIDGIPAYCHEFNNANNKAEVYMTTPNLPVRYEIINTNTTASLTTMDAICCSVMSEGGHNPREIIRSVDNGITSKSMSTTLIPVIQIRLNSSYIREKIEIIGLNFLSVSGNDDYRWAVIFNPTVTGGTAASWVTLDNSVAQYDITATGTVTNGTQISSGYISKSSDALSNINVNNLLSIAADIDGVSDVVALCCQTTTSTGTILESLSFKESA